MKIFSIQSRTSLAVWSVVLGIVVNIIVMRFSIRSDAVPANDYRVIAHTPTTTTGSIIDYLPKSHTGWPMSSKQLSGGGFIVVDLLFWIFVFLIIFSLIRYIKTKKV